MRIIECSPPELKAKWGPLAHVTEAQRNCILNLPYGLFKPAVKDLEKQIKALEKKAKAAMKESAYRTNHRHPGISA